MADVVVVVDLLQEVRLSTRRMTGREDKDDGYLYFHPDRCYLESGDVPNIVINGQSQERAWGGDTLCLSLCPPSLSTAAGRRGLLE